MAETPGQAIMRVMQDAAGDAVRRGADDLLERSLTLTPLDESTLRGSAHVEPAVGVETDGRQVYCDVVFNTPYAAAQHEGHAVQVARGRSLQLGDGHEVSVVHVMRVWRAQNYTTPGTGPKYLSRPLTEMAPRYEAAIGARVEKALKEEIRRG